MIKLKHLFCLQSRKQNYISKYELSILCLFLVKTSLSFLLTFSYATKMGVPGLANYLRLHYPEVFDRLFLERLRKKFEKEVVEALHFDLNSLIHQAAQKVYMYGKFEAEPGYVEKRTREQTANLHFMEVCKLIYKIVSIVKPIHSLILAVDGLVGMAKQNQQRQRRFQGAYEKASADNNYIHYVEKNEPYDENKFEIGSITPGTEYMQHLDEYIRNWIVENRKFLPKHVVYSSYRTPGEGEHKIMNYIREYNFPREHQHVIIGMDADLIFLSLLSPLKMITLIRDDIDANKQEIYYILNINILRKRILEMVYSIEDYILLLSIGGNDFLPNLTSFSVDQFSINYILDLYKQNNKRLFKDRHIISENLLNLFKLYDEEKLFKDILNRYEVQDLEAMRFIPSRNRPHFRGQYEIKSVLLNQCLTKTGKFSITKYRKLYFERVFDSYDVKKTQMLKFKVGMGYEYIRGLEWVVNYYNEGMAGVSYKWAYNFHYPPTLAELIAALEAAIQNKTGFVTEKDSDMLNCIEQLFNVIPYGKKHLLPLKMQPYMKELKEFDSDLEGKAKEHQAIALIPMGDFDGTKAIGNRMTYTQRQNERNKMVDNYIF